ncbi:hypothetical protein [Lysobacter gummosus]|uniref:hypothetical protein n=1 Tax=Lysobacter gummosus TaxID=262324 RepID=UPI003641F1A9
MPGRSLGGVVCASSSSVGAGGRCPFLGCDGASLGAGATGARRSAVAMGSGPLAPRGASCAVAAVSGLASFDCLIRAWCAADAACCVAGSAMPVSGIP